MQFDFLICSERSGSNLITKILDAHPEVCGPFPSHVIRSFAPYAYHYGPLDKDAAWEELVNDFAGYMQLIFAQWETTVTADELRDACRERTLAALVRYAYEKEAAAQGKSRVFVKENHVHGYADFMLASFPGCRFVWMVRDPRDMAVCQRGSILPGGVQHSTAAWLPDQAKTLELYGGLRDAGRILLIRFEDLLAEPEQTSRRVSRFLDLPYDPKMLEFHTRPNVSRNADTITAWTDLGKPLIRDNFNLYRDALSDVEIRYVEAVCGDLMPFFGYELDFERGDPEALRAALPDESGFNVAHNEKEDARYTPWREYYRDLMAKWATRRPRLA